MTLDIPESNLQAKSREQRHIITLNASISSELNIRTQEGDLVNLSFSNEQSLQESRTQTQSQELGSHQEISTIAKAASIYSISVQGDLSEEELVAIHKLAREISPIAREFFENGGFDFENSGDILLENLGMIEEVELSLKRTIVASFVTRTISQLPEESFSPEDFQATSNNPNFALETEGIQDFSALVQATFDAVFEAEATKIPDTDPILRSLNDLLNFIRQQLGEYFRPAKVEISNQVGFPDEGVDDTTGYPIPESD